MTVGEIARYLYVARVRAGLSQAALAERIGCGQPTISEWENLAVMPSLASVVAWASALDVEIAVVRKRS